eukprot:1847858-Rhodomonas_salina.1
MRHFCLAPSSLRPPPPFVLRAVRRAEVRWGVAGARTGALRSEVARFAQATSSRCLSFLSLASLSLARSLARSRLSSLRVPWRACSLRLVMRCPPLHPLAAAPASNASHSRALSLRNRACSQARRARRYFPCAKRGLRAWGSEISCAVLCGVRVMRSGVWGRGVRCGVLMSGVGEQGRQCG